MRAKLAWVRRLKVGLLIGAFLATLALGTGMTGGAAVAKGEEEGGAPCGDRTSVVASPIAVPADGVSAATITATLVNQAGRNPVGGKTVTLKADGGSSVITPASGVSDSNGVVTFTVTDTVEEGPITYTATDTTDNVTFGQTAKVSFTKAPDASKSTISATADSVPANGKASGTITVTVRDSDGNPIPVTQVTLAGSGGSTSTVSPAIATADADGVATFTVTDNRAETVTYTATAGSAQLAQTARLTFVPVTSTSLSTVVATPTSVPGDDVTPATIMVTLKDKDGAPVTGKTVALTASGGSSTISAPSGPSDASGVVTFTVKDTVAETVTYSARETTDNVGIAATATVSFTGPPDAGASSVSPTPASVAADGATPATVTVTVVDTHGTPMQNETVSLAGGAGTSSVISPTSAKTDTSGKASFSVTDRMAETVTLTATAGSTPIGQATVVFTPLTANADASTVVADPAAVPAGSTSTVTVTLIDSGGHTVSGKTVSLDVYGGSSTLSPLDGASNVDGVVAFSVYDGTAEGPLSYTATDQTDGVTIGQKAQLTFTAPPSAQNLTISDGSPTPANGTTSSTVSVTVKDASGKPIPGLTVSLAPSSGTHSMISPATATADANGVATFHVRDDTAETVVYTATVATIRVTQRAGVIFQAATSNDKSTVTASPSSVPADGSTASTITVTLKDSGGAPLTGKTVTLAASSGSSVISEASGPSDSSGIVTFTVTDTVGEGPITYVATDQMDGLTLSHTAQVTFVATPSAGNSTVDATPQSVPADGATPAAVVVTVKDCSGNPISGVSVSLAGSGATGSTISPASATSDASGAATFTVVSSTPGLVTYSATAGATAVDETAQVTFTAVQSGSTGGSVGGEGGGSSAPTGSQSTAAVPASTSVGSDGGTLATDDGTFSLTIPAGLLPGSATLGVTEAAAPPSGLATGLAPASPTFTLTGASLSAPQVAVIKYDPAALNGLPADRLSVYAQAPDGTWSFVPTAVNAAAGTVSVHATGPATLVVLANTQRFSDVPDSHWASGAIGTMLASSVVTGFPDGSFQPDATLTRAQLVKMLALTLGLPHSPASSPTAFTDVQAGDWFAPYVTAAVDAGLVQGVSSTSFAPDATVTREQMAVLLARALRLGSAGAPAFQDSGSIDPWAAAGVQAAASAGYIHGFPDGSFQPAAPLTRAQAAQVLAEVIGHMAP